MLKKVRCSECNRSFRIEGSQGTFKEVTDRVNCPYCKEPNEVFLPSDGRIYKAVPLYTWEKASA